MAKINITKPTGNVESLNILSAFKAENNTYVVLDGEKMGSMGLPIIYVAKYTTKLEKINDANEWQSVKNYLKGIISGTNFEYVKVGENISADEAYYTPLTLPQTSFDAIKNRYVVKEENASNAATSEAPTPQSEVTPVMPTPSPVSNSTMNVTPAVASTPTQTAPQTESVMNLIDEAYTNNNINNINNNMVNNNQPSVVPTPPAPEMNTVKPVTPPEPVVAAPRAVPTPQTETKESIPAMNFDNDKETFLKACENMFDALISKYQKELSALEEREKALEAKEAEINARLKDANEHLANAEAREQVANIAHDNAQKVMDLNNFMPVNPNNSNPN